MAVSSSYRRPDEDDRAWHQTPQDQWSVHDFLYAAAASLIHHAEAQDEPGRRAAWFAASHEVMDFAERHLPRG